MVDGKCYRRSHPTISNVLGQFRAQGSVFSGKLVFWGRIEGSSVGSLFCSLFFCTCGSTFSANQCFSERSGYPSSSDLPLFGKSFKWTTVPSAGFLRRTSFMCSFPISETSLIFLGRCCRSVRSYRVCRSSLPYPTSRVHLLQVWSRQKFVRTPLTRPDNSSDVIRSRIGSLTVSQQELFRNTHLTYFGITYSLSRLRRNLQ